MSELTRAIILTILILVAFACYLYGSSSGVVAIIVVGGLFELAFWVGLLSSTDSTSS